MDHVKQARSQTPLEGDDDNCPSTVTRCKTEVIHRLQAKNDALLALSKATTMGADVRATRHHLDSRIIMRNRRFW